MASSAYTIGDEISALKRQLPSLPEGVTTIQAALDAAKLSSNETTNATHIASLQSGLELEQNIQGLLEERKALSQKAPRDKHFSQGALLAFIGTAFAIEVRMIYMVYSMYVLRRCVCI